MTCIQHNTGAEVIEFQVLWQGKARLRRHLELGQADEEAPEDGGRGREGEGGAGDDSLYQVQPETRNPKLNLKRNPKPRAERVCGQ